MKLNKFRPVLLPKNRYIFARFGNVAAAPSSYSGDETLPPVSKVESIADLQRRIDEYQTKERDSDDAYLR